MYCVAQGDIGRRVKEALDDLPTKYRPADFARDLDISPQRLNNWLMGENDPPAEMLPKLARRLNKSIQFLLGEPDLPMEVGSALFPISVPKVQLPKIGSISAGDWSDPTDSDDFEFVDAEMADGKGRFACTIDGDSMYDLLWPGDLTIWTKYEFGGRPGLIVIARNGSSQLTTKQLIKRSEGFYLHPLNQKYEDQILKGDPLGFLVGIIRIVGSKRVTVYDPRGIRP